MKEGILKYVNTVKKLFIVFSVVVLSAFMVSAVFAFNRFAAFYIITPALLLLWLVIYGLYAMRVSMGTVIGIEIAGEVVHVKTKRRTYTYDLEHGCESIKVKNNKFIGTFATDRSRDKFIFYRRVLFSRYHEEQFTIEDIARFFPQIENADVSQK